MAKLKDYGIWEDERKPQARKLSNGKWECVAQADIQFCKADGKPKRFKRIRDTKEEAETEAWMARNKYEYEQKLNVKKEDKEKKTFTLGQYMQKWMNEEKRKEVGGSTYKAYVQCLQFSFYPSNFASMQLHMLSVVHFENFLNGIDKKYSYSVLNNIKVLLNGLCAYLLSKNLIELNFMNFAKIRREKNDELIREKEKNPDEATKEILTNEDIKLIYDNMKLKGMKHKYLAAYLLMIETSIRSEELFAIRLSDINKDEGYMILKSAISTRYTKEFLDTGKGTKFEKYEKVLKGKEAYRIVKLSKYAIEAINQLEIQLEAWCDSNPKNLLLPNYRTGDWGSISSLETMWKSDCQWLGIVRPKGMGPHKNRHTGITKMNKINENNSKTIRDMTGHKSEKMNDHYTHQEIESVMKLKTPLEIIMGEEQESLGEFGGMTKDELEEAYLKLQKILGK